MAVQVWMPTFGMTEGEAVIVRWLKAVGEAVQADEPLLEAETDKATLEIPAPVAGVLLRTEAEAGQTVRYKGLLGWIGQAGERIAPAPGESPAPMSAAGTGPATGAPEEAGLAPAHAEDDAWVRASPLARRIARDQGLDLRQVHGTGPGGRIQEADVAGALTERDRAAQAVEAAHAPARPALIPGTGSEPVEAESISSPLSPARRITAARLSESWRTAPHFHLQVEVRAARLVALRAELLEEVERQVGVRLSYTDLLLRGLALLLPRHPSLNASWSEQGIRTYAEAHLGVAVAAPQGLLVPVIRSAQNLSLVELARERDLLARQAKTGKLTPDRLSGGTFTLSNLGMYGVDSVIPVLNPPQGALLAAGVIADRPVGVNGQLVLQPTLHLTLAIDHRVADGAQAAEFLRDLRALLEAPARMLL